MSKATRLLEDLRHRNILVWVGGRFGQTLSFDAPKKEMTPSFRAELRSIKKELIELLIAINN